MKLPRNRPLTDIEIEDYCKNIQYFRSVFMRDALPKNPWRNEVGIVNLDSLRGPGTHWVAYRKNGSNVYYFDSFGNLPPPKELIKYFRGSNIYYNFNQYQTYNKTNCGQLCIRFLTNK